MVAVSGAGFTVIESGPDEALRPFDVTLKTSPEIVVADVGVPEIVPPVRLNPVPASDPEVSDQA
jgi:hypothetical protein